MQIIKKEILYKGWSTLMKYTIPFINDKTQVTYVDREIYDSGNGAAALLFNPDTKHVILTRQFRLAAYVEGHATGKIIEACAGMVDNLHPVDAIKKEILEETGYQIEEVHYLFHVYATPGAHMEKVELFLARYSDGQRIEKGGGLDSEHEDIEVLEYTYNEVIDMLNKGDLEDAKTIILLQHAIIQGIINSL